MKKIKLVDHLIYAEVDDEDYEILSRYDWYLNKKKCGSYACTFINGVSIYMHQMILPVDGELSVDHIDGNGLNNIKSNLRPATRSQQNQNRRKREDTSSDYKGVCWDKSRGLWQVHIQVNGKYKSLGRFKSEIKAARIYNEAALKYFGEFAKLNVLPIINKVS